MVTICNTCQNLQKPPGAPEGAAHEPFRFSTTLPGLRRSATAGCRGCALVLQGILLHHDRLVGVDEDVVRIVAESFTAPSGKKAQDHLSVELRWEASEDDCADESGHHHHHDELKYPNLKLECYTDQDGQSPFAAIGRGLRISENFFQDNGLETAKSMIGTCVSRHSKCQKRKSAFLPRRVLDVLHYDGSNSTKLHASTLDQDGRASEIGEYLTLSHCWGVSQNVPKTTTINLEAHQKNIPWSSLPKTFQEAVSITRALNFRYLWIDALCIIQDDTKDYAEQTLHMAEIYSNSFLTISATSSPDSSYGCILPKKQPFKVQATDSRGSLYKIYVREQPSHYSFKGQFNEDDHMNDWVIPFNTSDEANRETPLLKRAWAFQERLLSPRVLHFTRSEMILECREGMQCECGRVDDPLYDARTTDTVKREFASSTENLIPEIADAFSDHMEGVVHQLANAGLEDSTVTSKPSTEEAIQLWSYIITEYTSRYLTFDRDRLLAIAGVAKQFVPVLRGYIAGQWTSSTLNLLWYPSNASTCRRPRSSSTPIPSWSWASVEGSTIEFDNSTAMDLGCTAKFLSDTERSGSGPDSDIWSPASGQVMQLSAAMVTEAVLKIEDASGYTLLKNKVGVEFTPDVGVPRGEDALASGDSLICVLASMTWRSSIVGLVLKATGSQPQTYRRVGRFECYECVREGQTEDSESQDAEALFSLWFPEIEDMTRLEDGPVTTLSVV